MDRALRMAHRLGEAAAERGVGAEGWARIERMHTAAVALRLADGVGGRDHRYLHPGRSGLILLLDLDETDPATLGAAIAFDSGRPEWIARGAAAADPLLAEVLETMPPSGDEALAERLVVAEDAVRRAVLAERLDHLRHAHLWPDRGARAAAHAEAVAVYEPVAQRTHPVLARRYAWWCGMFAQRHLDR